MAIKVAKIQGLLLFPIVPPPLLIMICECSDKDGAVQCCQMISYCCWLLSMYVSDDGFGMYGILVLISLWPVIA